MCLVYLSIWGVFWYLTPLGHFFAPFSSILPASNGIVEQQCSAVVPTSLAHCHSITSSSPLLCCSKQMEAQQSQWRHKSDSSSNAIKLVSKTMNKWVKNPGLCTCKFPCSGATMYTYSNNWARIQLRLGWCCYLLLVSCLHLHYEQF